MEIAKRVRSCIIAIKRVVPIFFLVDKVLTLYQILIIFGGCKIGILFKVIIVGAIGSRQLILKSILILGKFTNYIKIY